MGGHWSDRFCDSGDCEEILLFFLTNKQNHTISAGSYSSTQCEKQAIYFAVSLGSPQLKGETEMQMRNCRCCVEKAGAEGGASSPWTCLWPSRLALIWTPVLNGQLFPERCPSYPLLQCPCYLTVYNVHWIAAFILLSVFPNKNSLLRRCLSVVCAPSSRKVYRKTPQGADSLWWWEVIKGDRKGEWSGRMG